MHGTPNRGVRTRPWSRFVMTFVLVGALAACGVTTTSMRRRETSAGDVEIESCEPGGSAVVSCSP
jgi:hypothetical protein